MGGAKKARPPIDDETQIPSIEVISVIFTATLKPIEILYMQLESKPSNLISLIWVMNIPEINAALSEKRTVCFRAGRPKSPREKT